MASVTVILKDNGGTELGGIDQSDPVTFSIEIISINDAPSFEHGGDIVMSEDAPLLSIPWATNLSDGDEGSQLLYFEVSSDNPSLFESPAAIDGSGYLTVALAPNAFGEAAMTVILKDNGGTDNGGVDQSEVVHFKITVNSVDDPPEISSFEDIVLDAGDPVPSLRFIVSDVDTPLDELELSVSVDGTLLVNEDSVFIKGTGNVRHLVMKLIPGIKGTAEVTVELSDDGSTVSAAFELEVLYKELALDIPNIFTPNNDGFNDTWNIINIGLYESSTVWVYTLEGKLIHKQSGYNYESEWSAEGVESGTYLYRIELNTGKRYSGKLKIIR